MTVLNISLMGSGSLCWMISVDFLGWLLKVVFRGMLVVFGKYCELSPSQVRFLFLRFCFLVIRCLFGVRVNFWGCSMVFFIVYTMTAVFVSHLFTNCFD